MNTIYKMIQRLQINLDTEGLAPLVKVEEIITPTLEMKQPILRKL